MQLLVLAPAIVLLGAPLGAHGTVASFKVMLAERPAASQPCEAPLWTLEPPTRALATAGPRIQPFAAALTVPLSLPPPTEDRLKPVWSIPTDSSESAPRSPRAPPVG